MKTYKQLKNELRTRVIELQNSLSSECSSYAELSDLSDSISICKEIWAYRWVQGEWNIITDFKQKYGSYLVNVSHLKKWEQ